MKLKSVASLKGPLACSIILILKTYFLSLTAMGHTPSEGATPRFTARSGRIKVIGWPKLVNTGC